MEVLVNRRSNKPTIARRVLLAAAIGATATIGAVAAAAAPANAAACPDPDYPCDPMPPQLPPKLGKPTVEFGCGTVTVTSGDVSVTAQVLPCPGPVIG
jgi:hypothetical protein